jgi:hypothetical protein
MYDILPYREKNVLPYTVNSCPTEYEIQNKYATTENNII